MDKIYYIGALLIVLLLIFIFYTHREGLDMTLSGTVKTAGVEQTAASGPFSVTLYEGFEYTNPAYKFTAGIRDIIPIQLKSLDINIPNVLDELSAQRRVEIWAVDGRDNEIASSISGFYNTFLEPEVELRANPSRYQLITKVLPGQHIRMNILEPVKKILILAIN